MRTWATPSTSRSSGRCGPSTTSTTCTRSPALERVDAVELFVDPSRWGEGIGGAALSCLLDRLFAEGIDGVVVDPQLANERAQRLYERQGFRWVAYLSPDTALMVARPPGLEGPRQRVPRPPGARPGRPAPWADVPVELRTGVRVDHVRAALDRVGGLESFPAPYGRVRAAVLIALFEEDGEARVVLTRRSSSMRSHRGEVSFPGGRIEVDETPVQAALREADEEVGIDPAHRRGAGRAHAAGDHVEQLEHHAVRRRAARPAGAAAQPRRGRARLRRRPRRPAGRRRLPRGALGLPARRRPARLLLRPARPTSSGARRPASCTSCWR